MNYINTKQRQDLNFHKLLAFMFLKDVNRHDLTTMYSLIWRNFLKVILLMGVIVYTHTH